MKPLPMDLTAGEALEAWDALWLRATDPAHLGGDFRHLAAYRTRFERLAAQEATGCPALPVALPAEAAFARAARTIEARPYATALREGRRMDPAQKVKSMLVRLRNKRRREHRKLVQP